MLIKYPPPMLKGRASVRIGPHRLEIDLPQELGNRPPAAQKGDAFSPQPSTMKDAFLFWVDHGSRPDVRLGAGRPVSRYAGSEGCAGLAGAEPHASETGHGGLYYLHWS